LVEQFADHLNQVMRVEGLLDVVIRPTALAFLDVMLIAQRTDHHDRQVGEPYVGTDLREHIPAVHLADQHVE